MGIRVYNTLTRQKEEFRPEDPNNVRIYVCGITPYAASHVGHSRFLILWDAIRRYLEYKGYGVSMVQNFTDVEDKLIEAGRSTGRAPMDIAKKHIREFTQAARQLGIKPAEFQPRASEHMHEIVDMIKVIMQRGHAYEVDGDVYFSVGSFEGYGKLSGRDAEDVMAGARIEVDRRKRDPRDFALWKAARPGEPSWPSPWGRGRPGWHIECSAMSLEYLGENFEFHGGGTDLIFPHHENEIAQSETYLGCPRFAKYWVHHEMLSLKQEKMSKSIGNIVDLRYVLDRFPGAAVRFFVLSTHYRKILEFSMELLEEATKGWQRLQKSAADASAYLWAIGWRKPRRPTQPDEQVESFRKRFEDAMDDDFNTAQASGVVFEISRAVNSLQSEIANEQSGAKLNTLGEMVDLLFVLGGVLGIVRKPRFYPKKMLGEVTPVYEKWTGKKLEQAGTSRDRLVPAVDELAALRDEARLRKDWAVSDGIRKELAQAGIRIDDSRHGSRWRPEVSDA